MASFFQQDPQNPYLPSGGQQLAQMLMSLGAGFSMAGANNQPWWAGIAPGAAMYGQAQQQAQQNALAMQQRDENLAYRKLQEEQMRAVIDERKAAIEARKNYQPLGLGVGGGSPSAAPQPPVPGGGMAVPPKPPVMGGGQNIPQDYSTRVAGYEGGTKNGGMVYNELGSGAGGPFQIMPDTWKDIRAKNPDLNLPEIMPVNDKPETYAMHKAAFDRFTQGNAQALQSVGIAPTSENLYLAHRFGAGGAARMLKADPNAMLSDVLPVEWQAQNPDMRGQTVGGFQRLATERMGGVGVPYRANFETTQYQDGVPLTPPVTAPPPSIAPVPQPQPVTPVQFNPLDAAGQPPMPRVAPVPPIPPDVAEAVRRKVAVERVWTPEQADNFIKSYQQQAHSQAQAVLDKQYQMEKEIWEKKYGFADKTAAEQRAVAAKIEEEKRAAEREAARRAEDAKGEGSYEYINGQKVWVSKAQRSQGGVVVGEAPKTYDPGSKALNYQILARGQMDPEFAKTPEYAAAYAAVEQEPIDVGGGEKRTPNMQYFPKPQAPVMNPEGAPKTTGQKAYTEAQSKDYTFASRLDNALPEFEKMLRDKDGKYSTANLPSSWERVKMDSSYYPDSQLTPETKAFRRVSKDIVTAILRKESGASIPLTEYPAEYAKYIPQPGDSHEEIAAKLKAIRLVARTFVEGSGRPTEQFKNIYGDEGGAASKSAPVRINLDGTPAK